MEARWKISTDNTLILIESFESSLSNVIIIERLMLHRLKKHKIKFENFKSNETFSFDSLNLILEEYSALTKKLEDLEENFIKEINF